MDDLDLLIACVERLRGRSITVTDDGAVDFELDDIPAFARVQPGGRVRGSVLFDVVENQDDFDAAFAWAHTQPQPGSCRLDLSWVPEGAGQPGGVMVRALIERDLDPFSIAADDPLLEESSALFDAWHTRDLPQPEAGWAREQAPYRGPDPVDIAPANAWLLVGDDTSYPDAEELQEARLDAARGIYEGTWTAAKQTEPGDLLLYYFTEPRKAIHFVARAADNAHFGDSGLSDLRYRRRQWWVHTTAEVEIEPVTLAQLQGVVGTTVMKGRSGRYIRPEHAAALTGLIRPRREEDGAELARVLAPVVGRADHPDPGTLDLDAWRGLAAGSFPLEADVERMVVEPLLRWATEGLVGVQVRRAFRVRGGVADYVVLGRHGPLAAVEVKLRIRRAAGGAWTDCKDFTQLRRYMKALGCPGILMDATSIHLVDPGGDEPFWSVARRDVTRADLEAVTALLTR